MDVRMPDGTIVRDVPDGITQADLIVKLKRNGYDTSAYEPKAPGAEKSDSIKQGLQMGPVSNFMAAIPGRTTEVLSGLAARGLDAAGATGAAEKARAFGAWRPTGFDREALSADVGNLVADTMATGKAAGLAGSALQAGKALPVVGPALDALGRAVGTFGAESGLPTSGFVNGARDLAARSLGAAGAGYVAGQMTDPENAGTAAVISGAIPVVGKVASLAGQTVADVVRPFTKPGQEQIAGQVLRDAAENPAAVAQKLRQSPNSYAKLTLAERSMDPGLASLQRTVANDPKVGPELTAFLERQNADRYGVLSAMTTGAESPEAIRAARQAATGPSYDYIASQYGQAPLNTGGVRQTYSNVLATPRARTEAVAREVRNAVTDNSALGIQRFGTPEEGWRKTAPMVDMWGARQNIDQRLYGGGGLDAKASAQAAAGELSRLRQSMSNQLDKIPGFSAVEKVYSQYSTKADAADTLVEMAKKATTNTSDMFGNPVLSGAKLTQALKSVSKEDWLKLTSDQRRTIQSLAVELQDAARAATLNKALGSNTVQNALSNNNVQMALRGAASVLPGGGLLQSAIGAGTSGARDKVMGLLGQAVMDPAYAAQLATRMPSQAAMLSPQMQALLSREGAVLPGLLSAQ